MITSLIKMCEEVRMEPGKNAKIEILSNYKDKLTSIETDIIHKTYSNTYNFGISGKYLRSHQCDIIDHTTNVELDITQILINAINGDLKGNELLETIITHINKPRPKGYVDLILNIFDRDLKLGANIKSINKAFGKGFIKTTPYMGAIPFNEKKARKLFENNKVVEINTKMDGRYANIIINNNNVELVSRQGKITYINSEILNKDALKIYKNLNQDIVLNAELLVKGYDRYKANGMINAISQMNEKLADGKDITKEKEKFLKSNGVEADEIEKKVYAVAWDYIPYTNYISKETFQSPRSERRSVLENAINVVQSTDIKMIDYKLCHSYDEALEHFNKLLSEGEEGAILKSDDGFWKDGKPTYQIKMKLSLTVDLEIIGFNEGKKGTAYEGTLGSLKVKSKDGLLLTDPGGLEKNSGIRDDIWNNKNKYIGNIVEVKSCGLSTNSKGNYSLLHPSFVEFRDDKDEADTLEQIKENQDMILGLN